MKPTKLENRTVKKVQGEALKYGFDPKYWKDMYDQQKPLQALRAAVATAAKFKISPNGDIDKVAHKDAAALIKALYVVAAKAKAVSASKQLETVCTAFAKHVGNVAEQTQSICDEYENYLAFAKNVDKQGSDPKFWKKHYPDKDVLKYIDGLDDLRIRKPDDIKNLTTLKELELARIYVGGLVNALTKLKVIKYREAAKHLANQMKSYHRRLTVAVDELRDVLDH
ncbi:MAG: hypothetical protein AB3N23_08310 [Paracoccaceae bacterium]